MGCKLIDLSGAGDCRVADGGIYKTFLADSSDIADVVFDATGKITNFVMTGVGLWFEYEFDTDDDTAFYNQTGARTNNKHTVAQQAFFKFGGITETLIEFANGIKDCCGMVGIHFHNTDLVTVQGLELNTTTTTWKKSKKLLKATVNVLTDTGANEDRVEISLDSEALSFSPPTSLTSADIEAL